MSARRTRTGVGLVTAVGTTVALGAGVAQANGHSVQTIYGNNVLYGTGEEEEWMAPKGHELWWDLQTGQYETWNPDPWSFDICRYQGAIDVMNPDGSYSGTSSMSSYHAGCSLQAWRDHNSIEGKWIEDKGFACYWRSSTTNDGWMHIGTLRD